MIVYNHCIVSHKMSLMPVRCFTCGKVVANRADAYEMMTKTINPLTNSKMTHDEACKKLLLNRTCCKRMMLTNVDINEEMIHISNAKMQKMQNEMKMDIEL